ncbi:MAG: hypothetical protein ACI84C_001608 [Flavobacteriales bacterium]|jgi:hypothetical protein
MKNLLFFLTAPLLLLACTSGERQSEMQDLNTDRQDLVVKVIEKNQQIQDFERYLNAVEMNMDKIREKEVRLSKMELDSEVEIHQDQLLSDLLVIGKILKENKSSISILEEKIAGNRSELQSYESTVTSLKISIQNYLADFQLYEERITDLSIEITALRTHQDSLLSELTSMEDEGYSAWFAYGNHKEMKENEVTIRKGGIFGLGGREILKNDFNRDYFAQIDTRTTTEIPLFCSRASLVSSHPSESFFWNEGEQLESLMILDPDLFWSTSKYLAIVVQ